MLRVSPKKKPTKNIIDKNAPGMDSPVYYTKPKAPVKNKKLPPKKMDKESKPIQSGRAAKEGKSAVKLLPRVPLKSVKKMKK